MPVLEHDLPGQTLDGYRVGKPVGRGAYAWVFEANQLSLDRGVALKVLDPLVARDPDAANRFDREGRAAARLDHPAIVDVHHAGTSEGLHFLAMRLIRGPGLDVVLRARGALRPEDALAVLRRIAAALDHAHARDVVHRDVKPSNILLERGELGQAWLGDFGIAVVVRMASTLSTATVGTASYMAPEQADSRRIGPAADQYSLACVAYEMLTGRVPFEGEDAVAVLLAHARDPVPPTGSGPLDAVFARALAKEPAGRYRDVAEFVRALDDALRLPVAVGPTTPMRTPAHAPVPPRAELRSPRRLWWYTGGAAAVVTAVVALVFLLRYPDSGAESGWVRLTGPGPVSYATPADWRTTASSDSVVIYSSANGETLFVGTEPSSTVDPVADMRQEFTGCREVSPISVAGKPAARCTVGDNRHITEVATGSAVVRFTFTDISSPADRDEVLGSVRLTGP